MKKQLLILLAAGLLFVSCGSAPGKYTTLKASGNAVSIPAAEITDSARFYNVDADGTNVQLVALRASDDSVRVAFNTCQNCSPSPKAYYVEENGVLRCQNCGFTFSPEEVGVAHGGCNPWPVDGIEITSDTVVVPVRSIAEISGRFANWQGPVK